MSTLDGGELSFFQLPLPVDGMTFQLQVQQGRIVLYASSRIRNPSAALYDVRLETDSTADAYLDPSDFEDSSSQSSLVKRQATSNFTDTTIFVSIEGLDNMNSFVLETTFGDTCKFSGKFSFHYAVNKWYTMTYIPIQYIADLISYLMWRCDLSLSVNVWCSYTL